MSNIVVNCGKIEISNDKKICLIAGPCQLETEQHAMDMAGQIQEINEPTDSLVGGVPLGAILMWGGGNTIPDGFTLCNAANAGTVNGIVVPDLEDKFIIGAKQHSSGWKTNITGSLGASGGSKDAVIVTHDHRYAFASKDDPVAIGNNFEGSGISNVTEHADINELSQAGGDDGADLAGFTADTQEVGSAATNANLPPYVALAYIIRTS